MSGAPTRSTNDELAALVTTPTVRRAVRRSLYWGVVAAGLLGFGLLMVAANGSGRETERWGAAESTETGSRAVLEVLRDQGVNVIVTSTLEQTLDAAEAATDGSTVLVGDERALLSDAQWPRLLGIADHLVIAEPSPLALDALRIDALTAGPLSETGALELDADCRVAAARRAGTILTSGIGYSTLEGEVCFDAGQSGAALIELTVDDRQVTVLGAGAVLQNGAIAAQGNAALALGLLGGHPTLIWYLPSPADLQAPTIAELTPGWVNPVAWLALTVGLAAAFWRGRRLGPVVVENLPVMVKTTETMEGRARLYARAGARLRALDAVRVGTLRRLADGLALGSSAGVDDIIGAVSAITGQNPVVLRRLLIEIEPADDRELVDCSDRLLELERLVARRVTLDEPASARPASHDDTPPADGRMEP